MSRLSKIVLAEINHDRVGRKAGRREIVSVERLAVLKGEALLEVLGHRRP